MNLTKINLDDFKIIDPKTGELIDQKTGERTTMEQELAKNEVKKR